MSKHIILLLRVISWLLVLPITLIFMIHPALLLDKSGHYSHTLLMLVMLGISGGFVHAVGYKPYYKVTRILLSIFIAWPLLLLGYYLIYQAHYL